MRIAAALFLIVALAGCSRVTGEPAIPGGAAVAATRTATTDPRPQARPRFTSLYSFSGGEDGANPEAGLTLANGVLYGTTFLGGNTGENCPAHGCGTVFTITASGQKSVAYTFEGPPDGANPDASLLPHDGALYGTTQYGGNKNCASGCGTVFSLNASGNERPVYSFTGRGDGFFPQGGLIAVRGTFYGTTTGSNGNVYSLTPSGSELVLMSFGGSNGATPLGNLVVRDGKFYGTTYGGGSNQVGTVFEVNAYGGGKTIADLNASTDGGFPKAGLVSLHGTLYGTTSLGGAYDKGTVFAIGPDDKLLVIYSFTGHFHEDGAYPYSGLTVMNGLLYGTTKGGGSSGNGTVFEVSTVGKERVLHSFGPRPAAIHPYGALVAAGGALYGTTAYGGFDDDGTVYRIVP